MLTRTRSSVVVAGFACLLITGLVSRQVEGQGRVTGVAENGGAHSAHAKAVAMPPNSAGALTRIREVVAPHVGGVTTDSVRHQGGCRNVIRNGDFELGSNNDWIGDTAGVITQSRPHFGLWGSWFGGVDDAEEVVMTNYSIAHPPSSEMTRAELRFQWRMDSDETTSIGVFDAFAFVSFDENDTDLDRLEILAQIDNTTTPRGAWRERVLNVTSHFSRRSNWSQSVLALAAFTDSSLITSWYIDDIVLEICTNESAPTATPSPTSTREPTATPSRTSTREPTATPRVTATATATSELPPPDPAYLPASFR